MCLIHLLLLPVRAAAAIGCTAGSVLANALGTVATLLGAIIGLPLRMIRGIVRGGQGRDERRR